MQPVIKKDRQRKDGRDRDTWKRTSVAKKFGIERVKS